MFIHSQDNKTVASRIQRTWGLEKGFEACQGPVTHLPPHPTCILFFLSTQTFKVGIQDDVVCPRTAETGGQLQGRKPKRCSLSTNSLGWWTGGHRCSTTFIVIIDQDILKLVLVLIGLFGTRSFACGCALCP